MRNAFAAQLLTLLWQVYSVQVPQSDAPGARHAHNVAPGSNVWWHEQLAKSAQEQAVDGKAKW